jgi:2-haloacid dehalogenase
MPPNISPERLPDIRPDIRAITFDVFGTLTLAPPRDGPGSDHWMNRYAKIVHAISKGEMPWRPIGTIFDEVGARLSELTPRPGVAAAFSRLRSRSRWPLYALSNAGIIAYTIAHICRFSFDGAIPIPVGAYKPDPAVYNFAVDYLDISAGSILHVAAHAFDLRAARRAGFRTAYIRWPEDAGERAGAGERACEKVDENEFDFQVDGLASLADALLGG